MNKTKTHLTNVTFNSHIAPLSTSEIAEVKGGRDSYGGSLERICRFLMKLVYGN